jgi:subtilisin family serine protease
MTQPTLLDVARLNGTGRGVRIAIVDSGVHAAHPHVQGVRDGVAIEPDGQEHADYIDRLGHGTAVAAAIREKAPEAELYAVKIFSDTLATDADTLVRAIEWCVRQQVGLINLSLGTTNSAHEARLAAAVAHASALATEVVAAAPQPGARWLPGALPGVIRVKPNWAIPRDAMRVEFDEADAFRIDASGFARPIPGVAPEDNIKGPSLAVANATGLLARLMSSEATRGTNLRETLTRYCRGDLDRLLRERHR